ncbi:unnamed protein product [Schistosoma margrebowiei]|uniref:Uncharacterized protein n=1 Tax=Schistosoma margrebowiei TaxID=48269 RepID=A0A183N7X9_9TREM|nr:unnamed protein product [Schistosoma margrebowiei]
MASLLDTFSERVVDNSSIWMMKKQNSTIVDSKKLEKAEAKIKEKQLKKAIIGRPGNAGGDLRLPPGVRVLHVEQEVVGDSTPALESVLQADIERHTLLIELARLQAEMKKNSGTDQGLSSSTSTIESRVAEIYSRLNAIEADKAPARAAVVLHGLGFSPEMQVC